MANERYGIRCPICGDCQYFGKTMCDGIYNNSNDYSKFLDLIYDWMWKHLIECRKEFQFGSGDEVLFEIIHEGHSDVVRMFKEGKHWNQFKTVPDK